MTRLKNLNPPLRSQQPAADILGFFDAVADALALHVKTTGQPVDTGVTFARAWPRDRFAKADDPFDVITFRVSSSMMAPTDNAGTRVPRAPQLREIKPHPTLENYNLQLYAWRELTQVEFTIWSRSTARADIVTDWFHRFMMRYAFALKFFQARGIDYFRFVSRADDEIDLSTGQEIYRRRLMYEIRLETIDVVEDKALESVDINFSISNRSIDSIEIT